MSLITPERARELLALLPEKNAVFCDTNEVTLGGEATSDRELWLSYGDYPSVDFIAAPIPGSDHAARVWPVLAASTDALRTIQHLYGLLEQHGITVQERGL